MLIGSFSSSASRKPAARYWTVIASDRRASNSGLETGPSARQQKAAVGMIDWIEIVPLRGFAATTPAKIVGKTPGLVTLQPTEPSSVVQAPIDCIVQATGLATAAVTGTVALRAG